MGDDLGFGKASAPLSVAGDELNTYDGGALMDSMTLGSVGGVAASNSFRTALDQTTRDLKEEDPNSVCGEQNGIFDFQVLDCERELYDLFQHSGFPLLICNVATKCKYSEVGFKNLYTLYDRYSDHGFTVLAFPCSQFGNAETISADEIEKEVPKLYPSVKSIDFPIMCKVDVNGEHELPLYGYLKSCIKGTVGQTAISWNFTYFVIDRHGVPIARAGPETKLDALDALVRSVL